MEAIRGWGIGIVLVSAVCTLVMLLSPSGSIEKQVRTAVAIVMLAVLVKPFLSGIQIENELIFEYEDYSGDVEAYEDRIVSSFKMQIIDKIHRSLKEKGIKSEKIEVDIKLEDNEISIERVRVGITEEFKTYQTEILEIIKNEFGIIAETEVVD